MRLPVNFRDLGGTVCADGRTLRHNRILRSAEVTGLPEDVRRRLINEHRLRVIVDLRSKVEVELHPDDTFAGVAYHNIDVLAQAVANTPDSEHLSVFDDPAAASAFMMRTYELMILDDGARAGLTQLLQILLNLEEGAALFHCQAGKDRTGVAAAILLTILGADRQTILEDYLKSNAQRKAAHDAMQHELKKQGASDNRLKAFSIAMTVRPEYLENAYAAAQKNYGSFEAYIQKALSIDAQAQARLKALYLNETP